MKRVITAAERWIGKKENSKGWWSKENEAAIQARKKVCRKLREARQRKDASLNIRWKDKRKAVKKLLRKEKKEMRRKSLKKLWNSGELVVNYSGQTWVKEKGKEGAYQD